LAHTDDLCSASGMMRSRFLMCSLTLGVALLSTVSFASADTAKQPVALAEVSVNPKAMIVPGEVRVLAESAIDRTTWPTGHKDSLVSVAVISESRGSSLTCLVSAVLRDKKSGAVYAIVESRATREQKSVTLADERATVSVALENAISRLPSALQ
jgi:hypothetical protein